MMKKIAITAKSDLKVERASFLGFGFMKKNDSMKGYFVFAPKIDVFWEQIKKYKKILFFFHLSQ